MSRQLAGFPAGSRAIFRKVSAPGAGHPGSKPPPGFGRNLMLFSRISGLQARHLDWLANRFSGNSSYIFLSSKLHLQSSNSLVTSTMVLKLAKCFTIVLVFVNTVHIKYETTKPTEIMLSGKFQRRNLVCTYVSVTQVLENKT